MTGAVAVTVTVTVAVTVAETEAVTMTRAVTVTGPSDQGRLEHSRNKRHFAFTESNPHVNV